MGRTHTKKIEAREARLNQLPRSERLAKTAEIKKKEGRVLDAAEKHALKMTTEYGDILRLWEVLRAQPRDGVDAQKKKSKRLEKKKEEAASAAASAAKKKTKDATQGSRTEFSDDEEDSSSESDVEGAEEDEATTTTTKNTPSAQQEESGAAKRERLIERYEHKYPVIDKLLSIITPKFDTFAKTPRVSRVIQSMIKYGSPKHLEKLVGLLKNDFSAMCNDAFAHFLVCALVRHAPHLVFKTLLALLVPVIPQLVTHKFGIRVVHAAYSHRLCSTTERQILLLGVFKDSVAVMKHWRGYPVLEDILDQELDHRKRLLTRLFDLCDKLVSTKEAFEFPFVQRLVHAFLKHGTKHEVLEMAVTLKPHLVALCETKEGSPLASLAFTLLEPKARKDALRQFGEKLEHLATSKYGAPVVAKMFDMVYDAQLLDKYVAAFFRARMALVLRNPYAYCILLHVLTPTPSRREHLPMLPSWEEYRLYDSASSSWNTHTWLNVDQEKETVEVVSKPADKTHLSVLGPVVRAFIEVLRKQSATAAAEEDEEEDSKVDKQYAALVAREILHGHEHMPAYRTVYALSAADVALLKQSIPNKDQKRQREEQKESSPAAKQQPRSSGKVKGGEDVVVTPARPSKKAKTESSLSSPSAVTTTVVEAVTPPPRTPKTTSASKPAVAARASTSQSAAPSQSLILSASKRKQSSVPATTAAAAPVDDDAPVERSARAPSPQRTPTSAKKSAAPAAKKGKITPLKMK